MAVAQSAAHATSSQESFPRLFEQYIEQNLVYFLQELDDDMSVLSAELDEQLRHTLNFAISHKRFWEAVRPVLLGSLPMLEQSGHWAEWLPYLEQAYEVSQSCNDMPMSGELAIHMGILYRGLAQYEVAEPWFLEARRIFEELGEQDNQAKVLNRLAYQKRIIGSVDEAKRLVQSALKLTVEVSIEKGISYNILGTIAYDQRDWEIALGFFQNALEIYQKCEEKRLTVMAYVDCALAYQGQNDYDSATIFYQLAQDAIAHVQAQSAHAHLYLNFGTLNLLKGNYESALAQCVQAEPILRKVGDVYQLGIVLHNQGFAYSGLKSWGLAIQAYTESKACFQQITHFVHLVDTLCELSQIYLYLNNIRQAEETLSEAKGVLHLISDQFQNEYYHSRYNALRTQFNGAKQHQLKNPSAL